MPQKTLVRELKNLIREKAQVPISNQMVDLVLVYSRSSVESVQTNN